MTDVIIFISGVVSIVCTEVHSTDNYVLRKRPSIQVRTMRKLPVEPAKFTCKIEYDGSQETRTLFAYDLAKIIVQDEEKTYIPTIQQIQSYKLWEKLGEEVEFPILENRENMGTSNESNSVVVNLDI